MKNMICVFIVLFFVYFPVYSQISNYSQEVDLVSDFNLNHFSKRSETFRRNLEFPFFAAGGGLRGGIGIGKAFYEVTGFSALSASLIFHRISLGPVGLSAEAHINFMKPTEKATGFSVTLSENERNSLTVPDVRAEGKISLFNIIEAGGGYLHTADNEYLKIEGNILNLTNLLPDFRLTVPIPFTKATIEIFDLKEVRSFNLFTIQKGSIDALSNTVITGLPLLRSISFDTFLNDDLVFIQPAFYLWISVIPIWFIPQYEKTNKLVTSYEVGIELAALLVYFLNRNKNNEISKLTKSEFRQYYDDLSSGLHYPGFPDPGIRSMLSTTLMFRHTFYDPYYSLTDKSRSIFIGIVQGGGVFVFNEKKYKKAIEDGGETYEPFIKKIVMMNNMEMGITYDLENQNFSVDFVVNIRFGKVLTPSNKE